MADDIASLGISVDSAGVDAGAAALRNYEVIARRTGGYWPIYATRNFESGHSQWL